MICSRAPAKVILFGEHFVVKGKPAIATAVDLYAETCIEESEDYIVESKQLGLKFSIFGTSIPPSLLQFRKAAELVMNLAGSTRGFHAVVDSEIPVAAGMGSSASTIVSFIHALLSFYGFKPELSLVNKMAFEAEKIVHGKPSGIDNIVATYGGTLYYKKGQIERLDVKWPRSLSIVVVDTGVKRSTKSIVREVLDLYEAHPSIMSKLYDVAEELVNEARRRLVEGDFTSLGQLININQGLLSAIGVSSREIEEIVYRLRSLGAIGSKLSGAGRGGVVYGVFTDLNKDLLKKVYRNYTVYLVKPINEGVHHRIL
ncbi:MAG: mevalonate kinase [Thermoprotei archaeon]|nr:MAG: mevalonate kinase [Thermoprotei archaeon]